MLILIGTVNRVAAGKASIDPESGKTVPAIPVLSMLHTSNDDPDSEQELIKIKLKDPQQAEAFRAAIGKNVRVPVRTWQSGEKSGFWLEKGVMPTVMQPAAVTGQPKAA